MNYINQIRGFWRAHEEHSFSTTEVAVYFYLLEVCNICHWKNPFKRNNAKIEADLGISFNTLKNARNRLAQTGLLSFKTTNGSPNVVYTLSNFDKVTNKVTNEVTDEVTDEVGDEVLTTKDKQNETETNLPPNPPSGGEGVEEISESDVKISESDVKISESDVKISESDVKIPEKEKSCAKKEKAPPHNFDFVADEFREPFIRFIEYRKNIRRPYRSQQGIETCYRQLMGFCNGDPAVAEQIVEQSIANEWQGLFKLQTQTNGTKKTINQRLSVGKQDYGEDTI